MPRIPHGLLVLAAATAAPTAAFAQPPGPLALERADLNGDTKTDEVRIGRDGAVEVIIAGRPKSELYRFAVVSGPVSARIELSMAKSEGRVLAIATDRDGASEALWIAIAAKATRELWRGSLEEADPDTATRQTVAAVDGELYRFFENPAVTRCDGKPARLEAEKLRGVEMIAASPPLDFDAAVTIKATSEAPGERADVSAQLFAPQEPSTSRGTMSPDLLGQAITLADDDPRTEWVEARPGAGRGEFVSFEAKKEEVVSLLRIVAGSGRSAADYAAHNRPKRIGLAFAGGERFWVELADQPVPSPQWIVLPKPIAARCVTVLLDSVYLGRGKRGDQGDTAISELAVLTAADLHPNGIAALLVDHVVAGDAEAAAARRKLAALGDQAVAAIVSRLGDPALRQSQSMSLRRILASLGAAPDELVKGLAAAGDDGDRDAFAAALTRVGEAAIEPLVALAADSTVRSANRGRAVQALGEVGGEKPTEALVALVLRLAGADAERRTRAALAKTLGKRGHLAVAPVIEAALAATGNTAADLYRAAGLIAHRIKSQGVTSTVASALIGAMQNANTYELNVRLLASLGGLEHQGAVAAVADRVRELGNSSAAGDVALRRVAVGALGTNAAPEASAALLLSTIDLDPGVRELAASALAPRTELGESDAPLSVMLAGDPWPSIRRTAAGALAARCERDAPRQALHAAARVEVDVHVGQAVLASVVDCGGDGVAELLVSVARATKRPVALRGYAISLLGRLGGAEVASLLVRMFGDFVDAAFSDASAINLAQAAADGLCLVGDSSAIKPLFAAANDSAYTEIRVAAIRALGCYCTPAVERGLEDLGRTTDQAISGAASRALRTCKKR